VQRSILLVAQLSPPVSFSAAQRVAGFTKYLARRGHRVTVLTSLASGRGPIEGAAHVVRTRDLIASRINWRRAHFESLKTGDADTYQSGYSRFAYWIVPDLSLVGWLPFLLPRALGLARREHFDCVITTSPPESAHFAGAALKARYGIPWIADLRDGWMFETTHPDWAHPLLGRLDAALERAVARRADLVVGVTEPITSDLQARLGARAVTITNGFDPEEARNAGGGVPLLPADRHALVHTGRIEFSGRTAEPLVQALRLLRDRDPATAAGLQLVLAGPLSEAERGWVAELEPAGLASALGTLPRPETLELQQAAGTLLLITGKARRSEATAKLYEYLAAGRPILVLGEEAEAARIVRDVGAGIVTSATDPERIYEALTEIVRGGRMGTADGRDNRARYSFEHLAEELANEIELLCANGRTTEVPLAGRR
jgi:glycosyltransferase involved in cell wall biosynthesis